MNGSPPPVVIRPPQHINWTKGMGAAMRAFWERDIGKAVDSIMQGVMFEAMMLGENEDYVRGLRDMYLTVMRHQNEEEPEDNLESDSMYDMYIDDESEEPTGEV